MKYFIVLIAGSIFGCSNALKCDLHNMNGDKIRDALSECVKNNNTDDFWEMLSENEENSLEETQNNMEKTDSRPTNSTERSKRSSDDTSKNETTQEDSDSMSKVGDISENCIIHCVLSNMDLVDANGMPDHDKLVEGIVKSAKNQELQSFLQDSVNECYQEIEKSSNLDDCSYSTKLVKCLADKGKENCADWPAGGLPF
ncbi:odorant-binding protein 59a isoform X1 [Diorhabda sublineata]|uniref:odorant-binding protein 59a isoform X1 n=2 Tax=Diorhabda sublineata TaxID=1163346 RepID=UPI0024E10F33|nr:odorant-binding protein 59a isoform X1 [Diorhabda sublineata]